MQNQRTLSYQQVADELRTYIVSLYGKKIFPRTGKIFADQLFLTGTEAGGYLSVLAELDEIHVKRDTAQCALIRLKRADYILQTMVEAGFYTKQEAEDLTLCFNKIIPAVKALLVEVYGKIDRDNAALLANTAAAPAVEERPAVDDGASSASAGDDVDTDPDGFYQAI
ncbi:MAG: hypothetical protein ACI4VK_06255 [Candidatus Coproplasma sp.]